MFLRDGKERVVRGGSIWRRSSWIDRRKIKSVGFRGKGERRLRSEKSKLALNVVVIWSKGKNEEDLLYLFI